MKIIVYPRKKKTEIIKEKDGIIFLNIRGKAENNEANNEIVRFFSKKFGKNVKIVKGLKSKKKVIKIY